MSTTPPHNLAPRPADDGPPPPPPESPPVSPPGSPPVIRLIIQQPSLAQYRVPVFRELAQRPGIDLTVYYGHAVDGPANVEPDGFAAHLVPQRRLRLGPRTALWHAPAWTSASRRRCDVLLLYWDLHYASLVPALLRAKTAGVPTILWGHGVSKREAGWRRRLRVSVARLATALLFYNHTIRRQYIDLGFDPQRLFVAPNSLDQTPIQHARQHWLDRPDDLRAFQQQHGLTDGRHILFIARLDPGRRLDLLLAAFAQLAPGHPRSKLILIGGGDHRLVLEHTALALGIAHRVIFTGPLYDQLQLAPWFLSSHLACFPSEAGLSLLHAFGYSLPVIATDRLAAHGPEIEALRHEHNGLLFTDNDEHALAAGLARLLDDEPARRRMAHEARNTVLHDFSLTRMVDGMELAVRCCAKGTSPHGAIHE